MQRTSLFWLKSIFAKGFTLIELMVAVAILSLGIVLVLRSICNSYVTIDSTKNRIEALRFLETKMNELEQEARQEQGIKEENLYGETYLGNRKANWKLEVSEEEGINEAKVTLFWQEANREKDEISATYFPKKK